MVNEVFLCILSGILLNLSFPNFNLWFIAWFSFVPLFFALQGKSKIKAFFLAYLTGFIFWWATIYWLVHVTLLGTAVLIFYLALYFGVFGLLASWKRGLIFIPASWVALEYIRSHLFTGFPWALLGYSQQLNLLIIQISDITGAWGVSFLVMMVNAAVYLFIVNGKKRRLFFAVPALLLAISLVYGFYRLHQLQVLSSEQPVKISVIQPNIPQELKWEESARGFVMKKYLGLTAVATGAHADLIVWPEAALPVVLEEEPDYLKEVADSVKQAKIPLLFGAVTEREGFYYNSACLLTAQGQMTERYDKIHLVPFGEYIPLKKTFPFLETIAPIGDITSGREYAIFKIQGKQARNDTKFSVLICFEDLFPELSRRFAARGAQFLINITNDAWYKKTSAAAQHFQASVFRAIENRVYVVRAANTGISGFIAPSGKVVSQVKDTSGSPIFVAGIATQVIFLEKRASGIYAKAGDLFIFLLFIFLAFSVLPWPKKEG